MATEQAIRVLEIVQPRAARLVTTIGEKTVCLKKPGRPYELVGIPPEGRTRRRTASAQDALVQTVELVSLLR